MKLIMRLVRVARFGTARHLFGTEKRRAERPPWPGGHLRSPFDVPSLPLSKAAQRPLDSLGRMIVNHPKFLLQIKPGSPESKPLRSYLLFELHASTAHFIAKSR